MKPSEIRDMPDEEIRNEINKARAELFKFRFHADNQEMQRAGEIRGLRRDIARMKTILRERQIAKSREAS
ncbi:MAG: 50S ribosomal protein L29 [Planctomycetota bacterium]